MNETNSTIIASLPSTGFDWQNYLSVFVSGFGLLTNLINIAVFLNRRLKDINYRYMFSKSMANLFYLLFSFLNEFFKNCSQCGLTKTFFANLYVLTINSYLLYSLAIFRILVEVTLSIRTFCMLVKHQQWFNKIPYRFMITTLFALSLLYYAQKPFGYVIMDLDYVHSDNSVYYTTLSAFGKTQTFGIILIVQQAVRIFLAVVLLTLINVLNLIKFRERFNNLRVGFIAESIEMNNRSTIPTISSNVRSTMNLTIYNQQHKMPMPRVTMRVGEPKVIKDMTRMVIFSSFINIICETPYTMISIVQIAGLNSPDVMTARRLTGILFCFSPMFDMFSYMLFNKHYRFVFNGYLLMIIKFAFCIE